MYGDLTKDREIDKMHLDEALSIQAQKYGFWADQYAEAKNALVLAKDELDATVARRSLFYRMNPPVELKPTEAVYGALVEDDREVQGAKDKVRVAQEAVNTLYAAVTSIQEVGDSLDNLVKLQTMKYYGTSEYTDSINRMRGN